MKTANVIWRATRLLIILPILLLVSGNAYAENPADILSKDSARDMFSLSLAAWVANVHEIQALGIGTFEVTPTGEYSLFMRPDTGAGLLIVTPSYDQSDESAPWKISVTVAADEEPAFILYMSMSSDDVKSAIQKSAREMAPEYSVMGYMVRNSKTAPSIHFTIFRVGDFPPIDKMNKTGIVCPPVGGEQACVRSSMIK